MSSELQRIALLAARFGRPATGVGIGDDAAVLEGEDPERGALVWTVDAQVEGTHFRLDWLGWNDVGWRSFMAAASDLAAMGAAPIAALSALVLAPSVDDDALAALADGQAAAAKAIGTVVVGGNLARGTETSVTTTLLGRAVKPALRSGARAGDGIWLAGRVGFAATGLEALRAGRSDAVYAECIEAWRRPKALAGLSLGAATAAIDVSDGLARDAMHLADASAVTLSFDAGALELPPRLGSEEPLTRALHGGEDYALLITSAASTPGFIRVGTVLPRGAAPVLLGGEPVATRGFDHFVR